MLNPRNQIGREVTRIPHRLEPFTDAAGKPLAGWTVSEFRTPNDAAVWFLLNQHAAMPCWRRMDVIDGRLIVVR